MKCCVSPIISTASRGVNTPARSAAVAFESLLLAQVLKPLAKPLGFYGDAVLDACAHSVASAERGGLADRLERFFMASSLGHS
jgi:hypothetical protein